MAKAIPKAALIPRHVSPKAMRKAGGEKRLKKKKRATSAKRSQSPRPAKLVGQPVLLNSKGSEKRAVLVLNTGGTIGMQEKEDGSLAPVPGALAKALRGIDELQTKRMPRCYFIEFEPIMDSADMTPSDWTSIARAIHERYFEYDGFVVLHGTDTLSYTASALSFMLEQLAKPVVITGAQLPIFEPVSDARQNFLGSIVFAGLADLCEVCVFFNSKLMRGNRTAKTNACSLAAFESRSYPRLAEVGAPTQIYKKRLLGPPTGCFRMQEIHVTDILVVWVIPGFSDHFFAPLVKSKSLKGMVLVLYGCGNAPARKQEFLSHLKQLSDSGSVILAVSQCTNGRVSLGTYAVGKAFSDAGVIGGQDITVEAAVTKMAYLFSKGLSPARVRQVLKQDLRGEMTTENLAFAIDEPVSGITSL